MSFDAFLQIEGIGGESTDEAHKSWIEVLHYQWQVSQPSSGSSSTAGARTAERADFKRLSIIKALDKASPKLALACAKGDHCPKVTLELCRAAGAKQPYMQYVLEEVMVASVHPDGSTRAAQCLPLERVSFAYGKITLTYTETDHATGKAKGRVGCVWDLKTNKGG